MQKNLLLCLMLAFLTSFAFGGHLMTPQTCFPCIFASNFRTSDNSLNTIVAIAASSDITNSIASNYLLDWTEAPAALLHSKKAHAVATARRLVRCRHARSADGVKNKRRDLNLCHFKICNMGRKRSARFVHTVNAINFREN